MATLMIQVMKYVMLALFGMYVVSSFYILRYKNKPEYQTVSNIFQRTLIFCVHGLGYLCLYFRNESVELLGFYIMQVILFALIFLFYHFLYKKCSVILLNNMSMLVAIGMIVLTRLSFEKAFRQFIFLAVGALAMMIIPMFLQKGSLFRKLSWIYFIVGVALLAYVVVMGSTSFGAKLTIEIFGFAFQPSEFVKIIFIFFIASMLYKETSIKRVFLTSCLAAIFVLLLVASRDLGGALLYFMSYLAIIYVASRKIIFLIGGILGMGAASVAGYHLFSHVQTRVHVWLDPTADIDNQGYQICQSLFGIGSGGWFGMGIGEGLPTKIPVVDKDFIFSAIAEEFGAIFAIGVILLCVGCFLVMIHVAIYLKDMFYKYVSIGLAVLYATQVILTIGGAIKFIPLTGVTLPLVSYGGSSMISTLCMFGIVQGLYIRNVSFAKREDKSGKQRRIEANVVQALFLVVFLAMIAYFVKFIAVDSDSFANNEFNNRVLLLEDKVTKGQILTSDGYAIAETVTDSDGDEKRSYPYTKFFSHVTGYAHGQKMGLEKELHFTLLSTHIDDLEKIKYELSEKKMKGDNAVTTIRYDLQRAAYGALEQFDGAVIAIEPSTGKILAMVSKPGYDPNTIGEDWDKLQEGTSLFNRASKGQYAPGSVFKMLTLLAYIESNPDTYENYSYRCTGEIQAGDRIIHCASNKKHGEVDLEKSFAKSCNTSFVNMMQMTDEAVFQEICDKALFNQELPIDFESVISSFEINESDTEAYKMQLAIGQGNTLVSPLHMAMLAAAVCNDGMVMQPQILERVENYKGVLVDRVEAQEYQTIFTEEEVEILTKYMRSAVEYGTASKLKTNDYTAYGKTGTAQTSSSLNETNAWFVGFAESDGKEIAIAVIVEDSGYGSTYAVPIAKKIFDFYFD